MTVRLQNPAFATRAEPFVAAGLLDTTDLHVVGRLGALTGVDDVDVLLGLAFAVRAPRAGHTGVDLCTIAQTAVGDGLPRRDAATVSAGDLIWPEPVNWRARTQACVLVGARGSPFERMGGLIQTGRLADYERRLAGTLNRRAGFVAESGVDIPRLQDDLARLFLADSRSARQRLAGALATLSRTAVISGGPGTGKTTTVRGVLLLLRGQSPIPLRIALAAPTGKAAARMRESLLAEIPPTVTLDERQWLTGLQAGTLHRLLGWQPNSPSRFRHDREHPLPHDVIVVDESSMVDVAMMCKLVDAVREDARLVLLGDRNQLASVEAGSVLADLTLLAGASGIRLDPAAAARVATVLGPDAVAGTVDATAPPLACGMVHFTEAFRFANPKLAAPIAALTAAALVDEPEAVARHIATALRGLTPSAPDEHWAEGRLVGTMTFRPHVDRRRAMPTPTGDSIGGAHGSPAMRSRADARQLSLFPTPVPGTVPPPGESEVDPQVIQGIIGAYASCLRPLRRDPGARTAWRASLHAIEDLRVLCAQRRGPFGVSGLNAAIFEGLRNGGTARPEEWVGRIVLVTENDYEHDLWNGDVGLVARDKGIATAVFLRGDDVKAVALGAMPANETAFAMTIHKSQGSQFGHVYLVLPDEPSPLLTRELVYTGISRAKSSLTLCCSREVLESALVRRVARASGLGDRLAARA